MKNKINLKSSIAGSLLNVAIAMLCAVTCQADPPAATSASATPSASSQPAVTKAEVVNYIVRVQWKDAKGITNLLQIVTAEGDFKMETFQQSMKIDNSDVPVIVDLNGSLAVLSSEKGRLHLNLGKKVPVVTSSSVTSGTNSRQSSYQYISVGLNSNFVVTFGKPLVIQADENGEVSILVKHEEN